MTPADALKEIRKYEATRGVRVDLAYPRNYPSNVASWIRIVTEDERAAEDRRETFLANRAAEIAQNEIDEASK